MRKPHKFQFLADDWLFDEWLETRDFLKINNDPVLQRCALLVGLIWCRKLKAADMWTCRYPKLKKIIAELSPEETRIMLVELQKRLTQYEH